MATNDQPNGILLTLIRYALNIAAIVGGLVLTAGLFFILVTRANPKPATQEGKAPVVQVETMPATTMPAPTPEPTEPLAEAPAAAGPEVIAMGEELFTSQGCVGCHTIEGVSQGVVGPDLTDIGDEAEERAQEAGVADAAAYIRESIVAPECPSGPCPPGVMPQNFGAALSEAQVDALVEYLLAQRGGG